MTYVEKWKKLKGKHCGHSLGRGSAVRMFLTFLKEITMTMLLCLSVQAVHLEMEQAFHEKDELKLRVHSYISEVSRIEKLMATKAREKHTYCSSWL